MIHSQLTLVFDKFFLFHKTWIILEKITFHSSKLYSTLHLTLNYNNKHTLHTKNSAFYSAKKNTKENKNKNKV